jgi:NADH-quinone oxidoreductase subunit M
LSAREIAVMAPLMALMLLLGFYPKPLLTRIEPSVAELLGRVHDAQARMADAAHPELAGLLFPVDPGASDRVAAK